MSPAGGPEPTVWANLISEAGGGAYETAHSCLPASCPLCGEGAIPISEFLRGGLEQRYPMRPHRCESCSLVFLYPQGLFLHSGLFPEPDVRRLYFGSDLEKLHDHRNADAKRWTSALKTRTLRSANKTRRLLDFGALTGRFCLEVAPYFESVTALEPDDEYRAFAMNAGCNTVSLLSEVADASCDVITLFHVFEHMKDPVCALQLLSRKLTPGGVILVETPNINDVLISRYRVEAYRNFHWHPARNYYWSKETLTQLGKKAGFTITTAPVQRHSLSNHLHWLIDGTPGGHEDLAGLISPETDASYRNDLCDTMTCDIIWAEARLGTT